MILFRPAFLALATCVCTCVSSEPGLEPRHNPKKIWVTVDADGEARTITPSTSGTSTVSGAPEYVTQTSVYALTTGYGMVQTTTDIAPVATATASSGAGAFFQCRNYRGTDAPFCQPRRGSVLRPGNTYYGGSTPIPGDERMGKDLGLIHNSHLGRNTIRERGLSG